jgi:hypothetical protein
MVEVSTGATRGGSANRIHGEHMANHGKTVQPALTLVPIMPMTPVRCTAAEVRRHTRNRPSMQLIDRGAIRERWTIESDRPADPPSAREAYERALSRNLSRGLAAEMQQKTLDSAYESTIVLTALVLLGIFLICSFFDSWGPALRHLTGR